MKDTIKQGPANLFKGMEGVGGKLYLTPTQLIHKPHVLNIQSEETVLELANMEKVFLHSNRMIFFYIPNGLTVTMKDGKEYKFVVYGRKEWKEVIEKFIAQNQ